MKANKSGIFWGMLLIIGGALALAQQLGFVDQLSPEVAMYSFAAISLVALVMYALSGWKDWGWLFPVGVFGGLAVTTALAIANYDMPQLVRLCSLACSCRSLQHISQTGSAIGGLLSPAE